MQIFPRILQSCLQGIIYAEVAQGIAFIRFIPSLQHHFVAIPGEKFLLALPKNFPSKGGKYSIEIIQSIT